MKKLIIFLFLVVLIIPLISSIDCSIYDCVADDDYGWFDFSNPTYNGTVVGDGDNVSDGGWDSGYGTVFYSNAAFNVSPVSILDEDWNDDFAMPRKNITIGINASCVDFMSDSVAGHMELYWGSGVKIVSTKIQAPCDGNEFCWWDGSIYHEIPNIYQKVNVWYTMCVYWNGSNTQLSLFNGSHIENITTSGTFASGTFVGKNFELDNILGTGNSAYIDNLRTFNGTRGKLGVLGGEKADDCTCPSSGNWVIDDGSICSPTSDCSIGTNKLRILNGGLRINVGINVRTGGCYVADTHKLFVADGGGLYCG